MRLPAVFYYLWLSCGKGRKTRIASVRGCSIASPRPTWYGLRCILLYAGLPLVGVLLLLDLALYLLFTRLLGRCYGVFCLLG